MSKYISRDMIFAMNDLLDRADRHGCDVATKVDSNGNYIRTPWELCETVLEKIHPPGDWWSNKTVVVSDTVEFIPVLLAFGVEKCKITFVAPYNFKGKIAKSLGAILISESLYKWNNMDTFDIVVGNPPYQEGGRVDESNKIWPFFVKKAYSLIKPDGFVALITPNTWMVPTADIKEDGFSVFNDVFKKTNFLVANIDSDGIHKKYFPYVGSTFSYYIFQNSSYSGKTIFITDKEEFVLDIREISSLPKIVSKESLSIVGKMVGKPFGFIDQNHSLSGKESTIQDTTYPYPMYHTNGKGGTFRYSNKLNPYATTPKVLISISGYYKPFYNDTFGFSNMCFALICNNKDEGKMAEKVLSSKLYRFWIEMGKFSGFNPRKLILRLPAVDLTQDWKEETLYSHFNIKEDEIKYIESIIV